MAAEQKSEALTVNKEKTFFKNVLAAPMVLWEAWEEARRLVRNEYKRRRFIE